MNIVKLDAIDSTSLFLKELSKNEALKNFTVVVADAQYNGKGQMNTKWHSADGENLLFTIFVNLKRLPIDLIPFVNFLVAIKLRALLENYLGNNTKIQIKWPNDIMSYSAKLAGVLVENLIRNQQVFATFVGIGLNVNQVIFPDFLPNAVSMSLITGLNYDRDIILNKFVDDLKEVLNVNYIQKNKKEIKKEYLYYLYKVNIPSMFKDKKGNIFMAKIIDVSNSGLLVIEKEDELSYTYAVKEISFL